MSVVVVLATALVVAGVFPGGAAAAMPCMQTGTETVSTDRRAYLPGEVVHMTGAGYAAGCDVVVKVTRPDGAVVTGDGSATPGSDTVTTDLLGGFSYEYQLQSVPAVEGWYTVEVLGFADALLAQTSFVDAFDAGKLFLGSLAGPENYLYTAGDTIVSSSDVDASSGSTRLAYKFFVLDAANAVRNSPTCTLNGTGGTVSYSYTVQSSDPASTNADYQWVLREYGGATDAAALSACNADTDGLGNDRQKNDFTVFNVAKATVYANSALTTPQATFGAASTLTGTVAKTSGSTTLTGTGTAFTTQVAVGDTIAVPHSGGAGVDFRRVTAIASNTSLTVNLAWSATTSGQTASRSKQAYVTVAGLEQNQGDYSVTWLLPGGGTACANTSGGDQPNSDADGDLPNAAPAYLEYVPSDSAANWNRQSNYESAACPRFSAATQGQWKLKLARNPSHFVTLNVFSVSVNGAPTANAGGPYSGDEGSSIQLDGSSSSDPDGDPLTFAWSAPAACTLSSASAPKPTLTCDDDGSYPVSLTVTDDDGASSTASTTVTVAGVAPTASFPATRTVDEGGSSTFTFTTSRDPSGADSAAGFHYAFSCTGASLAGATYAGSGTSDSVSCSFADGPSSSTVRARIIDKDGASTEYTTSVTVDNVAPTISLSGANSANEGQSTAYTFSVSDPGQDTFSLAAGFPDCGSGGSLVAGSLTTNAGGGSFECSFPDGPASPDVRIKVDDSDGAGSNVDSIAVTVANVAPAVSLSGANAADEGQTETYDFAVTDPGADTFTVVAGFPDCDTGGNLVAGSLTTNAGGGSFECSFPDGPASPDVRIKVDDSDGAGSNVDSIAVTVANIAPTVTISGANAANEGQSTAYTFSVGDPGQDTFSFAAGFPDCGSGGSLVPGSLTTNAGGGSFECSFPDGPASPDVRIKVDDSDGADSNVDSIAVTVANVAPTVTLAGSNDLSVDEGSTHTYGYSISDPGQDTVSAVVTGCGGTGAKVAGSDSFWNSGGSFKCSFADGPDSSTVSAAATDSDGDTGSADAHAVTVENVAPTLTLSASNHLSVAEGSTHTYGYSISDPGLDTVSGVATSCGPTGTEANASNTDTAGSFDCTFPDGPAGSNVSARATDSDGAAGNIATQSVTVENVAPSVTIDGPANVDEGSTHTYTFTVTDPGQDTFVVSSGYPACGTGGTYAAGSLSTSASGGIFECSFPDGPATTDVAIKVADSDGASDTASEAVRVVAVANVPPSVTAPADQSSDEGESHSFALGSFTDHGENDAPWDVTVAWGDGSPATTFSVSAAGPLGSRSHTYADGAATHTVNVTVSDKDGGTASNSFEVSVRNVAPSVSVSGPAAVDEGQSATYTFAVSDPGDDGFALEAGYPDCGSGGTLVGGSVSTSASGGSFDCSFPDGPASPIVSVQVRDADEPTGSATAVSDVGTRPATVKNVAPAVSFTSGAASADENETRTYGFLVSDPGLDTYSAAAGHPDCGTGGGLVGGSYSVSGNSGSHSGSFECAFPDGPASPSVQIRFIDSDGDAGNSASRAVTVTNLAPSATFNAPSSVTEGQSINVSLTNPSDPSSVDAGTGFQYRFSCDNGLTWTGWSGTNTHSCATSDNGTRTAMGAIRDKDGGSSEYTKQVAITNGAPHVAVTSPTFGKLYAKPASVAMTASFTDPGTADTHTCSFAWDDGGSSAGAIAESNGSGTCSGTHAYTTAGVYSVKVTVSDDEGDSTAVEWMVVVYDANGGFVTGGGWIDVAPGSYPADPLLSGRANFGFNSQYKKGATIPTGETEFQFKVGDLNFHSTRYDFLVVSGYKAQYKGVGDVNGVPGYSFRLTAYDGGLMSPAGFDKFRIKITDATGATVFDNRIGKSDDMDAADPQTISGGSIVIHKA